MREEIEALGRLVDVASEIEVGLAELARNSDGEARKEAERLTELADGLADNLTAIYIGLAKTETQQQQQESLSKTSGAGE
ncbi:MAG: hypothetical protein WKF30_08890 [Pyrinomonadaceae bacterium]